MPDTSTITAGCTTPAEDPMIFPHDRAIDYFWPVRRDNDALGDFWAGVQLSCYHSRTGKRFVASMHPMSVYAEHTRTAYSFQGPHWGMQMDVPRFSQAKLEAFATTALIQFRQAFAHGNADVLGVFEVSA